MSVLGVIPEGWDNQIQNDFLISYRWGLEKRLLTLGKWVHIDGNTQAQIGTIFTKAEAATNFKLGYIGKGLSYDNNFQFYAFARPIARFTAYDASLMGVHLTGIVRMSSIL